MHNNHQPDHIESDIPTSLKDFSLVFKIFHVVSITGVLIAMSVLPIILLRA